MFIIEAPYFNLDQIYNSGQAPRWIKLKEGKYIIPFKNKALKIEQKRDNFNFNKYRLMMSCSENDFYNIWFNYFDLRMDCLDENMKIKKLGGKFKVPANRGRGIHILYQDYFEAYIFAKLVVYAGYKKAADAMNHIAKVCGVKHIQSMREAGRITWYEWPTPEMILDNHHKLGKMGKINSWLKRLCEAIINDNYDYIKSNDKLFRLFGMHDTTVFPLTGIEEILMKNFDNDPNEIADQYLGNIKNKGMAYMYIVHHILNRPKEIKK